MPHELSRYALSAMRLNEYPGVFQIREDWTVHLKNTHTLTALTLRGSSDLFLDLFRNYPDNQLG